MRTILATALAAGLIALSGASAGADPLRAGLDGAAAGGARPAEAYAGYYYGRRYYGGPYHGRGYYRRGYGGAVAAGVAGIAAGALIAGAVASSQASAAPRPPATLDDRLAAWCANRYRSFDPVTGTYLARTGERVVCTYP